MNVRNNFTLIGRLAQDPVVFDNSDGSKKVRFTLATKDNFKSKGDSGMEQGSQFIPVEGFISKDNVAKNGIGVYGLMHQGDLVAVTGQIQNNNYTDKDGVAHYDLVLQIETRDLLEPKSVTDARAINRAVAAQGADETPVE